VAGGGGEKIDRSAQMGEPSIMQIIGLIKQIPSSSHTKYDKGCYDGHGEYDCDNGSPDCPSGR